jgi:uncharacterized protein (TIGR00255 family)
MLKSMTAFGRACLVTSLGRFIVEIQSVNRKHLEISTFLPKELIRFDPHIKNWIAALVSRGQIILKMTAVFENESPLTVQPNLALARQYKNAWDQILENLGIEGENEPFLRLLTKESGILLYEENIKNPEEYAHDLEKVVNAALQDLMVMKEKEGRILQEDILKRLQKVRSWMELVKKRAPEAPQKYRQKLIERIKELIEGNLEEDERILKEIAIYSEKVDITEEFTRFDSHLKQVEDLIQSETVPIGKTLEFLIQELNRETNTISAKSSDLDISKAVVEIKSELEKIREQIQNIE